MRPYFRPRITSGRNGDVVIKVTVEGYVSHEWRLVEVAASQTQDMSEAGTAASLSNARRKLVTSLGNYRDQTFSLLDCLGIEAAPCHRLPDITLIPYVSAGFGADPYILDTRYSFGGAMLKTLRDRPIYVEESVTVADLTEDAEICRDETLPCEILTKLYKQLRLNLAEYAGVVEGLVNKMQEEN